MMEGFEEKNEEKTPAKAEQPQIHEVEHVSDGPEISAVRENLRKIKQEQREERERWKRIKKTPMQ